MKSIRVTTTLRIPEELDELIAKAADRLGISKNAFITMAIDERLQEEKNRGFHLEKAV
ncbi:MAG: toxin-antitoxin system HicB family antitoxin [Acidobacterium ailaaui]|nr:toxin-antitoxin system HicB family antitoxin [Pseudacidobacterium ailaaui]